MQKTEQKLYTTPFSRGYWRDAAAQLFDVRILCVTAVLIALRVAIKAVQIPIGPELNITFGFFVNALGASIFGPVVAMLAAAITDTLGCILFPQGSYFFPFIFVEIAGSLVFALWLWRAKLSATRVILSRFSVSVVCNYILNPLIMIWYYAWLGNGQSYAFVTLPRVVKNVALFPFEAFLLVIFMGAMIPILARFRLIPEKQVKPILTKWHILLLALLLIVAILVVVAFYFFWMPTQPQSKSATVENIKLTLKSDRERYSLKKLDSENPFTITVTVKNNSDAPFEAEGVLMLTNDAQAILYEAPIASATVEPGKSHKLSDSLAAALDSLSPGDYLLRAVVSGIAVELPISLK